MEYLIVGKITNTHGLKGELKIKSYSDFDRFFKGNVLYLKMGNEVKELKIKTSRMHKGLHLLVFEGFYNINDVLIFKGQNLLIKKENLEELPEDEFYYHDLVGKEVFNEDNVFIGKVSLIMDLPNCEILRIKRENNKDALVPFNDEFIKSVDTKIVIKEIEGLL